MTRSEHLNWAKERALEYVDAGDNTQAFSSMISDLRKHPETASSATLGGTLGMGMLMSGHLATAAQMRKFIEGFN